MKRLFRYLALALLIVVSSCGASGKLSPSMRRMLPAEMPGAPEQLIVRKGYVLSYNCDTKLPNWVFWNLTGDHVEGKVKRPGTAYHEDTSVPNPRAAISDYRRSGYSRGHICPAGDNKWDRTAMYESFALTNICPQTERCNSGVWNSIEMMCREWAKEYDSIYIVSGPILSANYETIGANQVAVPDAFFKVVVCLNGRKKGIGFICENDNSRQTMKQCVVTIEEIEQITGIDFFPNLSGKDRRAIEEHASLRDW